MPILPDLLINSIYKGLRPLDRTDEGIDAHEALLEREDGTRMPILVLAPEQCEGPLPCLVYYHGGGFRLGMPPNMRRRLSRYVREAGCIVVSPRYRLSGTAPFPAAFDDCYAAFEWVAEHSAELGIDPERIALGGDSAGGNLAAAAALAARDRRGPKALFQMLLYPVLDYKCRTRSMDIHYNDPFWNGKKSRKVWETYLREGTFGMEAYASPLYAGDFSGLPPAYIEIAEKDCLRDEAAIYGRRLERAGVAVEMHMLKGARHGYDNLQDYGPVRRLADKRMEALRRAWAGGGHGE